MYSTAELEQIIDGIDNSKLSFDGAPIGQKKSKSQSIEYIEQEINNIIDNSDVSNLLELRNKLARFIDMQYLKNFK